MKRPHLIPLALVVAVLSAVNALPVAAQVPAKSTVPDAPRFSINRFEVSGGTLLKPEEVEKLVAPYTGTDKDFGDIQRALQAIEGAYRKLGYGSVQVQLPEQDITSGVVKLNVVEQHIGKVVVEGNQNFSTENVLASLPTLQEGALPNSREMSRNLQMLEEHPVKHTAVLLKSGSEDNQIDATVKIIEDFKPIRYFVSLDNTGNKSTGDWRAGLGFQHSNMFHLDHVLTAQYVTSPGHLEDVKIFGAGYHVPLYKHNISIDLVAGYADVDSGTLAGLFSVSGSGTIFGARLNYYLPKYGDYSHKWTIAQDYRAYQNRVLFLGAPLVPDITVHPTSFTYSGLWRMSDAEVSLYASIAQNLISRGDDGNDVDFKASRVDASAGYRVWRFGLNYIEKLRKDMQFRGAFNGQYSDDALVSGEQFGFGGANSVRGFNEREVSNDRGFSVNLELYSPDFGNKLNWGEDMRARALVFYDAGYVRRNKQQLGETAGDAGSSVGTGVRFTIGKQFSLRADYAYVMNAAGAQDEGDSQLHVGAAYIFD